MPRKKRVDEIARRDQIQALLREGRSIRSIVAEVGCSKNTVRRTQRNTPSVIDPGQYQPKPILTPVNKATPAFAPLQWVLFSGVKRQILRVNRDGTLDLMALKHGRPLQGVDPTLCKVVQAEGKMLKIVKNLPER